ncbi:hypothetical protein HJG60_008433 [Phyllostomus discolor]|uniref:Uncharacterized protein n=1 Tax=Phyllostomus discolor TaxID=89673 RepID=A0A833YX53_9CHIR|nr:hypothetical protein HJG60_008433 [Phyllostomus discolor]
MRNGKELSRHSKQYENPKANILNGKVWNISLRSGTKQGCPLSPLPPHPVLEVPAGAVQQEKKTPKQGRKKNYLYLHSMILHMGNPKEPTRKVREVINSVRSRDRDQCPTTSNERQEEEVRRAVPLK